ncbi:MAG: hypothetical protein HFJ10_11620 [Lachnospiraceae bacterium]|jgi:Gpi18-like mannosyltransferase|nr:hypothetical protein [Lachnospiraceae bacterium]
MDDFLRDFVFKQRKFGRFTFSFLDVLLAACITGTGVMLRLAVVEYTVTNTHKLGAMFIDFILAYLCAELVYDSTRHRNRAFLTYSILVIYPTMIANSALWGQNSVYYVFFLFVGLYFWERGRKWRGLLGIAVGVVMALARMELSTKSLTLGWPNFYEIIGKEKFADLYNQVSVLCLTGILLTMIYIFVKKNVTLTRELSLRLFLFLALLIPYFAPSMPAWAGLTADIAALVYCMRWPKKFYVPMLHLIVSYSAYANIINGETKLPMPLYSVILLILLTDVGAGIYQEVVTSVRKGYKR